MCLPVDGAIVATAGSPVRGPGSMIYVFEDSGRVVATHRTPAESPTNCTFAEDRHAVLYVTFSGGEVYRVADSGLIGHLAYPEI